MKFAPPSEPAVSWASITLWAGLSAAVIEMIPVLAIQGFLLKVPPLRIFQAIASGVLGSPAYRGGLLAAVFGAALHVIISLGAAAVFVTAARRAGFLNRHAIVAGLAFGIGTWFVMTYIVVPLSAAAFAPTTDPVLLAVSITVHMVAFGLPIALVTRWRLGRPRPDEHSV